jgi:hypothetical protein
MNLGRCIMAMEEFCGEEVVEGPFLVCRGGGHTADRMEVPIHFCVSGEAVIGSRRSTVCS